MASHTSIPRSAANMASSLTRAMFTCRNVFSRELGQLGLTCPGHGHGPVDQAVVEALHGSPGGLVDTGDHLGGAGKRPLGVAGVDPLRAVPEGEVCTGYESRPLLQDGADQLLGRARVGRGLENHGSAWADVAGQ